MSNLPKVLRIIGGKEVLVSLCPPRAAQGAFDSLFDETSRSGCPIMKLSLDEYMSREQRQGPCPDDCEVTAPFIDGDPIREANDVFLSRPLKFDSDFVDSMPWANDRGFQESVNDSIVDRRMNLGRT